MDSRIKDLLKEKGVTLSALAEQIGMTQTSLSRALGENGNPTFDTLNKIANALNVGISDLFQSRGTSLTCPHCGKPITLKIE